MINAVEAYLAVRRAAGFTLSNTDYLLRSFARFAATRQDTYIRTATVIARTPVTLYALERDDFLAAVTSHPPSARAADAVVGQRLTQAHPSPQPPPKSSYR